MNNNNHTFIDLIINHVHVHFHIQGESDHHLMAADVPLMFSKERDKGIIMLGGEEGTSTQKLMLTACACSTNT